MRTQIKLDFIELNVVTLKKNGNNIIIFINAIDPFGGSINS